ncbi:Phenylalanyl-tRNA synthetase beta chain [hydrothermal vent metagenome]|uniref:Phenylalanine--tRNA ligase beta subunit n=1 Tax=hydrothermal vent metagenome TaxID=652676 RepID=A0A3B1BSJ6_9ZZZZ
MKFSEKWLREWVNPDIDTDTLAHQLTMAGLEVEAVEPVAAEFEKIVVGEVLSVEAHPDADKLRVCKVDVGDDEPLGIVCGAANVRAGLKVPAALVGAKLPGGLKIKKSKLRGVPSHGMLCSEQELGLVEQADGLMELPPDAPVGIDIREYLKLDDVSIELGLTPNRGDCLSIAGIAREVAGLNRMKSTPPVISEVKPDIEDVLPVKLDAGADCPRYVGRIIRDINPAATTPLWLQEKLRRSGLRSLGPVIDVTNFILLELGQPMHAFDLAKLTGEVLVRHAKEGERLTLLDGQQIKLQPGSLLIADKAAPLALAGIMGGADSAVSDETRDIFLESAYFNPLAIAGRARSYGLHTDSSHRFERGVSFELQRQAMERATALLLDIVGGRPGPIIEQMRKNELPVRVPVKLREARIRKVLGVGVIAEDVVEILLGLDMVVEVIEGGWKVTPPAFRFDIEREVDLIEEIGRIYGYDNLPESRPQIHLQMQPSSETRITMQQIRQVLVQRGYYEAITYSFVDPKMQKLLDPAQKPLALMNPISSDLSMMRTSLWPGLVQAVIYNLNRQQNRLFLFESGLKFVMQGTELQQKMMIAGVLTGDAWPEQWSIESRKADYYDIKAHVEALLTLGGNIDDVEFRPEAHPALHPGQSAAIYHRQSGNLLGHIGALHPEVEGTLGLNQRVFVFELALDYVQEGRIPVFSPLSRFPAIRRDIAVLVDEAIESQKVHDCILRAASSRLQNVELFDVYVGEGIDSGRKSLALGLTLQDLSRTLTDSEVDSEIHNVVSALGAEFGATLRE